MLPALCKGVEKTFILRKINKAFKRNNFVEKILDYTPLCLSSFHPFTMF